MDAFFDIPTLVAIGIAVVVLFRLRQVLGTKIGRQAPPRPLAPAENTAEGKRQDPRPQPVEPAPADDDLRRRRFEAEVDQYAHGDATIAEGFRAIAAADPSFTPKIFLEGAKQAYEWVLTAFAEGDRKTLRELLDRDVYAGFEQVIAAREAAGQKVTFTFVGLPKVEISHASTDRRTSLVAVQFHGEVISVTRDAARAVVDGDAAAIKPIADEWTFARNPKSRDPNWKLAATQELE